MRVPPRKAFMHDDFLLESDLAVELYHGVAAPLPIIDYHCHLSPELIANNHGFADITEAWLQGDHYKWRAMRTHGISETLITGPASTWEKFRAWASTVPFTLRNPLYHWTHLELKHPFGLKDRLLDESTAAEIFARCNEQLHTDSFRVRGLLRTFKVHTVCTTDDPTDSLSAHIRYANEGSKDLRLLPTFRADRALAIEQPHSFNAWISALEQAAGMSIESFDQLLEGLARRHQYFHDHGCRLSDHGLETVHAEPYTLSQVDHAFRQARVGASVPHEDVLRYRSALLYELAVMDHAKGWVQQFHLGAMRNNNTRMMRALGPDTGFDSIGDFHLAVPLARFLDRLDSTDQLAKTILYNLNSSDNDVMATMLGNFQDGSVPGKIQFGSAWWFLDQLDGMEKQMNALSNMGLLSHFVGMLTDSRSFLSYSRHEYFRRLLCNMLAHDARRGLIPEDHELLKRLVENICFYNAQSYFAFESDVSTAAPSTAGGSR